MRIFWLAFLGKLAAAVFIAACALLGFGPDELVKLVMPDTASAAMLLVARVIFLLAAAAAVGVWVWAAYFRKPTHDQAASAPPNRAVDRMPLGDMMRRLLAAHKEIDFIKFFADLRQAACDEEIRFWGRLQRDNIDFFNSNEPLLPIPKGHWIEYEPSPLDMFTFDNKGQTTGVQTDSKKAFSYRPGHGFGRGCYVDLHAHRQDAETFMKKHGI